MRPVIAARCDGDNLPLFNSVTNAMRAGIALHYLDPVTTDFLGPYPYGKPFAIGHECIAEVLECGEEVRDVRKGQLVIVPWAISCGGCRNCCDGLTSKCTEAGGKLQWRIRAPDGANNMRQLPGAIQGSDMLGVSKAPFAKLVSRPGPACRSVAVTSCPRASQTICAGQADQPASNDNHLHAEIPCQARIADL